MLECTNLDPNIASKVEGNTSLHTAAKLKNFNLLGILLNDIRVDATLKNIKNQTYLDILNNNTELGTYLPQ